MRPKSWRFTPVSGDPTTIYWPTDVHVQTQQYAFNFRIVAGAGSFFTTSSASYTIDRILSDGIVSAHWTEARNWTSGTAFTVENPASCWRFRCVTSGDATVEIMALQPGPERM